MNSLPPPLPKPPHRPLVLPLIVAFVPAMIVLVLIGLRPSDKQLLAVCGPATLVSIGCCLYSSIVLFKRNTTSSLVFGVLLCMVNVFITLGLGCAAFLGRLNVH